MTIISRFRSILQQYRTKSCGISLFADIITWTAISTAPLFSMPPKAFPDSRGKNVTCLVYHKAEFIKEGGYRVKERLRRKRCKQVNEKGVSR